MVRLSGNPARPTHAVFASAPQSHCEAPQTLAIERSQKSPWRALEA